MTAARVVLLINFLCAAGGANHITKSAKRALASGDQILNPVSKMMVLFNHSRIKVREPGAGSPHGASVDGRRLAEALPDVIARLRQPAG
jgi:hypothetical protein